jgi:hypothetical protein
MAAESALPCPGCGLVVGPADGPTHPYIGGSPGCWALFNELMTIGPGGGVPGQLAGDTYAVQHPGLPERRAIQSVCLHLVSLCAALERNWPADKAPALLRSAVGHPTWWHPFELTTPLGVITVAEVLAHKDPQSRGAATRAWADDLWSLYRPYHAEIRGWLDDVLG